MLCLLPAHPFHRGPSPILHRARKFQFNTTYTKVNWLIRRCGHTGREHGAVHVVGNHFEYAMEVIMFFYSVVINVSSTARVLDGAGGLYPVISIYQPVVHQSLGEGIGYALTLTIPR